MMQPENGLDSGGQDDEETTLTRKIFAREVGPDEGHCICHGQARYWAARDNRPSGGSWVCQIKRRKAVRKWEKANPETARQLARRSAQKRKELHGSALSTLKIEAGCVDCGYRDDPVALDFDHKNPGKKQANIGNSKSRSIEFILDEVDKCDVRCANCHRIRTRDN